jgi:hypothetical protein
MRRWCYNHKKNHPFLKQVAFLVYNLDWLITSSFILHLFTSTSFSVGLRITLSLLSVEMASQLTLSDVDWWQWSSITVDVVVELD